ncbi:CBL-interacting serine/threonine-protein kinase 12-like [Iris pallida]|uniref:CBL-interacting serine/threonine-protein kinase 12-like n=1 Tax=Iris pallida TaxID=29817 RepID=A0AAX6GR07_IRIPA|nr:CBL-interacting serine/threonine-protein kinase 12-like [Iris pallida]
MADLNNHHHRHLPNHHQHPKLPSSTPTLLLGRYEVGKLRPRHLRQGLPRPQHPHQRRGRHQGPRQGEDPQVRPRRPHKARDIHPPPRPPPQHRPALRGHGHQVQDLLRHGVRPRRRALPEGRQGPPQGGRRPQVLPAAHVRRRVLPRPRRLPPRPQAREPPPRRQRRPQGLRLRPQRRLRPDPPGRPLPHLLRDPGLRRPRGARQEGIRRRQGRHLVLRRHPLRPHGRLPPFPRSERHVDVSEDLQRRVPLPEVVLARARPPAVSPPRYQSADQDHHTGDHGVPLVQERLSPYQVLHRERRVPQMRRARFYPSTRGISFRREGEGEGGGSGGGSGGGIGIGVGFLGSLVPGRAIRRTQTPSAPCEAVEPECVRHNLVLERVRPLGTVRRGRGAGEVRVWRAGVEDHIEAGGDCQGCELHGAEEGLPGEPGGDKGGGEGPADDRGRDIRAHPVPHGGRGEEESRGPGGVRRVL